MAEVDSRSDETEQPKPLQEFTEFLLDFNSIYAQIAKLAMAAPLLDLLTNIGPPWPSRLAVSFLMVIVQVLVVMCSFALWRQGQTPLAVVKRRMVLATAGFIASLILLYLPCFAFFVVPSPDYRNAVVVGWNGYVSDDIATLAENMQPKELLANFKDDPTLIWSTSSLAFGRLALLTTWLITALLYAIAVSAFIAVQYRHFR